MYHVLFTYINIHVLKNNKKKNQQILKSFDYLLHFAMMQE